MCSGQNQAEQGHYSFISSPHKKVYLALQVFLGLLKVSILMINSCVFPGKVLHVTDLMFCVEELFHEEVPEEL